MTDRPGLDLSEGAYRFTIPLDRWADDEIDVAMTGLQQLAENVHDAFLELAAEYDRRETAYAALQDALDDIEETS